VQPISVAPFLLAALYSCPVAWWISFRILNGFDHFAALGLELSQIIRLGRIKNIMNDQELPRRALDLSLAIYRVTARFPQGEVLAGQIRGLGNEIAGDLAAENFTDIKNKVSRLKIYFAIAKAQNWVRLMNWSVLEFEYHRLQQEVLFRAGSRVLPEENKAESRQEEEPAIITSHNIGLVQKRVKKVLREEVVNLPLRQDRILKIIQNKGLVKMSDLVPLFKDEISERTLRNELQTMVAGGSIKKRGEKKYTEYYK